MSSEKEAMTAIAELLEVVGKHFFASDGLAKDIPYVGTFFAGVNFLQDYRNKKFAKRIMTFLTNFSPEDFDKFRKVIANKSNEDLGEEILSVIENLENDKQVIMTSRATLKYISLLEDINSEYSYDDINYIFYRNIFIIKQLDTHLLSGFIAIYSGQRSCQISLESQSLLNLGLLEQKIDTAMIGLDNSKLSFKTCEFGQSFYKEIVCGE